VGIIIEFETDWNGDLVVDADTMLIQLGSVARVCGWRIEAVFDAVSGDVIASRPGHISGRFGSSSGGRHVARSGRCAHGYHDDGTCTGAYGDDHVSSPVNARSPFGSRVYGDDPDYRLDPDDHSATERAIAAAGSLD